MNLTGRLTVTGGQTKRSTASPEYAVGTAAQDRIGRVYRYCQVGALPLVVGNVIQSAAAEPAFTDMAPQLTNSGATVVRVTPGAAAAAANTYADGFATISTAPGFAETYGIEKHPAIVSTTAFDLTLYSDEPIQTALTTASRVDIRQNPYKGVVQAPLTALTGVVVGVAIHAALANEYCWIQTWGPCGVLTTGTPAIGAVVAVPGSAAGSPIAQTGTLTGIGEMMSVGVTAKAKLVNLRIAP
jgi:hypothetical protein